MEEASESEAESHLHSDTPPERSLTMNELSTQLSSIVLTSMREVMTSQQHQQPASLTYTVNGLCHENQQLSADLKTLQQDLVCLNLYLKEFQTDHRKLLTAQDEMRKENETLRRDVDSVKTDQSDAAGKLQTQLNNAEKEMTSMREEMRSQQQDLVKTIEENQQENQQLRADLGVLQSDYDRLKNEYTALQAEVANVQAHHSKLAANQNVTKTEIASIREKLRTDMDTLRRDQRNTQAEVDSLQQTTFQQGKPRAADMTTVKSAQHNLMTEVSDLKMDQERLISDLDTIRTMQRSLHAVVDKMQAESVDPVLAKQRQLVSEVGILGADVEQINALLMKASSAVNELVTTLGKARRLFYVSKLDKAATEQQGAMIFKIVVMNDGGCYSEQSGLFSAPRAGLYVFTAAVASRKRGTTVCSVLMVGAVEHCVIPGGAEGGGSGSVVVRLAAREEVWVRAVSPVDQFSDCLYTSPAHRQYFSYFSGTLVLAF